MIAWVVLLCLVKYVLCVQVLAERAKLSRKVKPPLLVKISPDLTEQDKADVAFVVGRYKVDSS